MNEDLIVSGAMMAAGRIDHHMILACERGTALYVTHPAECVHRIYRMMDSMMDPGGQFGHNHCCYHGMVLYRHQRAPGK